MIEIEIDGKKLEVAEGSMVIQAAEANGTYIHSAHCSRPANSRLSS